MAEADGLAGGCLSKASQLAQRILDEHGPRCSYPPDCICLSCEAQRLMDMLHQAQETDDPEEAGG